MAANDNSQFNATGAFENDTPVGFMRAIALWCMGLLPAGQVPNVAWSALPSGAVQKSASSGNVANAIASAALAAPAGGRFNYCTGIEITGAGATAGLPVTVTLAGVAGGTQSFTYVFQAGVLVPNQPLIIPFLTPLKAAAANSAITLSCPAGGAGNTNNVATIHGFDAA